VHRLRRLRAGLTEAIFANDAVPEDQKPWIEVNALWYKDKDAARAKVNELKPPA